MRKKKKKRITEFESATLRQERWMKHARLMFDRKTLNTK